ncbi:hypothetical protein [Peristeroidobacter agariperforans]|uniref:hypothetical protein n=1 Tax=Peristeroidobacter agariperforans TaxID=268404 RepID=UPI00101DE88C|nr:hypothetical protein [Peristeroidobacter agariperforans]
MMAIKGSGLQLCTALPGTLAAITRAIKHMGLDGIVAKGQRSTYRSDRRGPERQKKRFNSQQEFAIGGYRPNGQDRVESLMVGVYEGSALKFVCKVRAGLDKTNRSPLRKALQS